MFSHAIRGKHGKDATLEEMHKNNLKAIQFGQLVRLNLPRISYYLPGEHDEFVSLAYQKGFIGEEQILEIDCTILDKCDGLLVYSPDNYISLGMGVEIDYAGKNGIATYYTDGRNWAGIKEFVAALRRWG